jgi:hypothetical protein
MLGEHARIGNALNDTFTSKLSMTHSTSDKPKIKVGNLNHNHLDGSIVGNLDFDL